MYTWYSGSLRYWFSIIDCCCSYFIFFVCRDDHNNIKFQCQLLNRIKVWLVISHKAIFLLASFGNWREKFTHEKVTNMNIFSFQKAIAWNIRMCTTLFEWMKLNWLNLFSHCRRFSCSKADKNPSTRNDTLTIYLPVLNGLAFTGYERCDELISHTSHSVNQINTFKFIKASHKHINHFNWYTKRRCSGKWKRLLAEYFYWPSLRRKTAINWMNKFT